jgi:hypothetical protein
MTAAGASAPTDLDAARFVQAFAEAWAGPHRERLLDLLHPEVRLVQPLFGRRNGTRDDRSNVLPASLPFPP